MNQNNKAVLEKICAETQVPINSILHEAKQKIDEIYPRTYRLSPEAIVSIEFIIDEGFIPSVWTNNIPALNTWMEQIGLLKYISSNAICNSYYYQTNKPSLEFFQKALSQLNCQPKDVLFIDDEEKNKRSASILGIPSYFYSPKESLLSTIEKSIKLERKKHDII